MSSIRSQLATEEGDCAGSGVVGDVAVRIEIKAMIGARIGDQLRLSFQRIGAIDQRAALTDRNDVVTIAVQRQQGWQAGNLVTHRPRNAAVEHDKRGNSRVHGGRADRKKATI